MDSARHVVFDFPYHECDDDAAEERLLVHQRERIVKVDIGMGAQKVTHCDRVRHASQRRTQPSMKFKMSRGTSSCRIPSARLQAGGGVDGPYGVCYRWRSGLGFANLGGCSETFPREGRKADSQCSIAGDLLQTWQHWLPGSFMAARGPFTTSVYKSASEEGLGEWGRLGEAPGVV